MADAKPRTALRIENLAAALEQPLREEASILDVLIGAMGRGQTHDALWADLHKAAQRDDRLAELAFAYERISRDKKLKALPASAQAVVLGHAGAFSGEIFGDADGAEGFLERALTLAPGDRNAFEKYERILRDRKDLRRLGELYLAAAPHRGDRAEQLALLRRGAEAAAADPERALKLHAEILRLEPGDAASRKALEDLYDRTGRLSDLAKLLEQTAADPAATDATASRAARSKLVTLYAGALGDVERALPHVEEVLKADPLHEDARRAAEGLLGHKTLTARAAAALSAAYEAAEEPGEAARIIAIEIEVLRGPKRLEAQKRLARITLEQLGDLDKTFPMYEAIVPLDPSDDEVRGRFVQLASAIDKQLEATRTLARAATGTRDPVLRARINADLGDLFRELGDTKKARASYQGVLDARADEDATLRSGRAMAALSREPRDPKGLAAALGRLAEIEPTEAARLDAIAELARVTEEDLADLAGAIAAYERLQQGPRERDANEALLRLYEATGKVPELVRVLDRMAADEKDVGRARELSFRAAELLSSRPEDRAAALRAWQAYIATHGSSREALAKLGPLLEQERRWDELAQTLSAEAALAPPNERAAVQARLGHVLWTRKNDPSGALAAFASALAADPGERQSRASLEKMLAVRELGLAAADILEPIVREEAALPLLTRLLEARASLSTEPTLRLAALAEAAELLHDKLRDPKRATDLVARGLADAALTAIDDVPAWVERVDRLGRLGREGGAIEPRRRAELLSEALGDRAVDHPALRALARRAGEALVESGNPARALEIYRRALAVEPASADLLSRVDALLREQGTPEDRLALYRAALAALAGASDAAQRREVRRAIGSIQRHDLGDREAALLTYREALEEAPDDRVALAAVLEIYEAKGAVEDLYAELERALARATGVERTALLLRLAELAATNGWFDRAAGTYATLVAEAETPPESLLAAAEAVARAKGDVPLRRAVLERRVAAAIDPAEEATWLTALAELLRDEVEDAPAAVNVFRQAAGSAELAGDNGLAATLLERLLALAPRDRAAAERLLRLHRDTSAWEKMPPVYALLLRGSPSPAEAAHVLAGFESVALSAGAGAHFVREADALLELGEELPVASRGAIRSSRARVLAADPARFADAVAAYKVILEEGADPAGPEAGELEALLRSAGDGALADRRWLLAHRADRASDADRASALLAWAREEERTFGDRDAAATIYERVLATDPDHDGALVALARLHAALGRHAETARVLEKRRANAEGPARIALDVELASLLLGPLDRPTEALDVLASVLEAAPAERAALDLARQALAGPARGRAADLLERTAEASRDAELATSLLDALLATDAADPELTGRRRAWFARYLEAPGLAPLRALEVALAAASETPADLSSWDRADQLARAARRPDLVAAAYREVLARNRAGLGDASVETVEDLGRRAVEFHEEWFDDEEAVVSLLQRAVALAPSSAWAFERLKLIFNLGERWADLFALYDGAIEVAAAAGDRASQRDLLEDAALAAKDLASDHARSMHYYEALYQLAPDARIRAALQRMYERSGKHRALIDLLEAELADTPGADPELVQRTQTRIAQLWLEVGDPDAALSAIERLVHAETVAGAGRDDGFEFLERFLAKTPESPASREARRRAAALLKDRYRAAGRSGDLARMLRIELEGAPPGDRGPLLREIAALAQGDLHDEALAFDAVAGLLALEPSSDAHADELARLSERIGRPAQLAEALVAAAESGGDHAVALGARGLELLARAAEVYEARLGDVPRAIDVHRRVLAAARAASETDTALAAARKLHALLASSNDVAGRIEALGELAALTADRDERRSVRRALAHLAREAEDLPRAISALQAVLADDPADVESEADLVQALEVTERWQELASVLETRASRSGDEVASRADRVRIARLHEDRLADVSGAIDAWTRLRATFGADEESSDALAHLLERADRVAELAELLEAEASAATDPDRAADLWSRVGDLHRARSGRLADAVAAYEFAVEQVPAHSAARRGLEALLELLAASSDESRAYASVVTTLTRLYRAADDRASLAALLEPRLVAAISDARRVVVLRETAEIRERDGDVSGALEATLRALSLGPSEVIGHEVARLAERAGTWDAVGAALASGLSDRPELPVVALSELSQRVALWYRDHDDVAAAEATLTRALARDPESESLLANLAGVLRAAPGRGLVETLLRLAAARGGDLDTFRDAVEVAERAGDDRAWARQLAAELLDRASARFIERGAAQTAAWAIEALVRLSDDKADRSEWLLRGASLPFGAPERRRLRLAAAALAEGDAQVALYEELFTEAPGDAETASRLEQIYRAPGGRADLVRLRERQIAAASELHERKDLRLDLASLLQESGDAEGAIEVLRANLNEGFDGITMARLSELYEVGGHDPELVALYEERAGAAERAGDRDLAASLFARAATVAEERLRDATRAIGDHRKASALGAASSDEALARLFTLHGDHAAAAAVLERMCDRLEAAGGQPFADVLLRLIDALRGAGNVSLASARLERAARSERAGGPLRKRFAGLLREAGAWRALAEHLARNAGDAETSDPLARVALLREAAEIHLVRHQDPEAAIPLLEQAAALVGDDPVAAAVHLDLAAARRATGDLESAANALRSLLAAYGARRPKERARVHYELAQVDLASGARDRAIGELDAALRIDPAHAEALHALAKLSLEEGQLDRAARTYRALLLVVKRPSAGSAAGAKDISRAEVLFELAEIARLRGESARAAEQLESAFEAARESEGERERLVAVLRTRGRHDLLARALEKRLGEGPPVAEAAAIQDELATLYEHHLGRIPEALEARLSALSHGERDLAALGAALALARRASQVERYVGAVTRFAENERDEARAIQLYVSLGRALEEDLKDDARAASAYRKAEALAAAPLVPDALLLGSLWRSLAAVYGRLGDVDAEEALLERMIAGGGGAIGEAELADALYQLAELRLRRRGAAGPALELLDRALAIAEQPARAAKLLHAALAHGADATQIGRALEHVARSSRDDRMLVEALVVLAGAEEDPLAAIESLREAVEVARRLDDPALGEDLLRRALRLDRHIEDAPLDWALIDLAARRFEAGDLLEAADLRERAARVGDPDRGRALLLDVAALAAGPLDDPARAVRLYEEVREREPSDRDAWEPLLAVVRRTGDRAHLAALLDATAPLVEDLKERNQLRLERSRLAVAEGALGYEKAISVLRDVLEDDPADTASADVLADLLEKLGRREELASLARAQLDAAKDREDRAAIVPLSLRLGALLEQQWDEQGALDVYHAALEWEPKSAELLRQVVRVGASREDALALADALDALLSVEDTDESVDLALRLAKIRADHDDAEGAAAAIEKGFRARPGDPRLRAELTRRYTELGSFAKLAALAVSDAEARPSQAEQVKGLREAADLLREQGGDARGAAEILARALDIDTTDRAVLAELVELFSTTQQEARAIDAVTKAIAALPDDAGLYRMRATLADAIGRAEEALADLEEAYQRSGGEHVAELISALRRAAGAPARTPEDRAALHRVRLRLAGVLAQTGEIEAARQELTELVQGDPRDRTALHALALLEESQDDWDAAIATYARVVALEEGEGLVVTALHLAEACERADRLGEARDALERARQVAPDNAALRQRLRDLYNLGGHRAELGALLIDDASRTADPAARFTVLMQAGRLLIASEGEAARAASVFDEARVLRPDDAEATLLLADAYTIGGRLAEARTVLEAVVASQRGRRTRALGAVHRRLARLDLAAGDNAAALAALTRAFDNDAQNAHLAMELGTLAVELEEHEPATRAFRAVTLMKVANASSTEAATPALRALAYYHLGRMAFLQGDRRKARLMIDKAVADDPSLDEARELLEQLRNV